MSKLTLEDLKMTIDTLGYMATSAYSHMNHAQTYLPKHEMHTAYANWILQTYETAISACLIVQGAIEDQNDNDPLISKVDTTANIANTNQEETLVNDNIISFPQSKE